MIAVTAARLAAIAPLIVDTVEAHAKKTVIATTAMFARPTPATVVPANMPTTHCLVMTGFTVMEAIPVPAVLVSIAAVLVRPASLVLRRPILVRPASKTATVTMLTCVPPIPATVEFVNMPTTLPHVAMASTVTAPIPARTAVAHPTSETPAWPVRLVTRPPILVIRKVVAVAVWEATIVILISVMSIVLASKVKVIVTRMTNVHPVWYVEPTWVFLSVANWAMALETFVSRPDIPAVVAPARCSARTTSVRSIALA
jgi:hypothetical protein